ncbi:class I SAM-dependent methyltransferase [Peredibacter starrii]|uniref:Methyltransferase domain-containing protein n=1 Tax=Peredibacter starrii TaxID=28202 RepID=A0AAX4HRP2_9BACT|nr:methyltransferase domain-containing protein [Peredibacter starrii]WPU65843.1 methyltransferase domain-containing protein [Peredibacter starrii]
MKKLTTRILQKISIPRTTYLTDCNICKSRKFTLGPNCRRSPTGLYPRCISCKSLERHRIQRKISLQLQEIFGFNNLAALRFSNDPSFSPDWFKSFETSIYDGENSLDVQAIDRDSESYDVIIINHVLEHVQDDKKALKELARIINKTGFIFISVPQTISMPKTIDWGYPDEAQHGHFRHYGKDFSNLLSETCSDLYWIRIYDFDPVTYTPDEVYILSHSRETIGLISNACKMSNLYS